MTHVIAVHNFWQNDNGDMGHHVAWVARVRAGEDVVDTVRRLYPGCTVVSSDYMGVDFQVDYGEKTEKFYAIRHELID